MEVQVISSTVQKFNGESYYRCGHYFQRKGRRLHREVWKYHNGDIPEGYHVHHIDNDKSHNSIGNLELLQGSEHLRQHMNTPESKERSRKLIEKARTAAIEWHKSAAGSVWHAEHGKDTWKDRAYHSEVCDWCGKEFTTRDLSHPEGQHFCCGKHRSLATQWRYRHDGSTDYPRRKS